MTYKTFGSKVSPDDITNIMVDGSRNDSINSWKTIPNMITICRILGSPVIMMAIANDMKKTALFGCIIAGFSDWLDGYIAKNYDMKVNSLLLIS